VFVGVLAVLAMTLADAALPSVAQRASRVAMWRRLLMTVAGDELSGDSPEAARGCVRAARGCGATCAAPAQRRLAARA
jgi:hypothetical protein